ncbi:MAG: sporulation protein YqfD [Clostridia bacterium]|nr:sporulation protein YqfD [Clostridia bacterium]
MVTRDFINLIFGCVSLRAENGFAERFINTCTAEGIPLWDIRKTADGLTAKTTVRGYRRIRLPARKSSMRVRMTKKTGLPFLISRHIHRTGLIAGFAVMILILNLLSGHIWIIDVTGNTTIPDSEIISAFEQAGLTIGKSVKGLVRSEIESEAMLILNNTTWAAINIKGCTAEINVRELEKIPDIETHQGTSNIVARKDGQIEVIEVYRGSAAVKRGEAVTRGDLLISGVTESRTQQTLFADADGYIVARTDIDIETGTPKTLTILVPKTKKIHSLYFLGIELLPPRAQEGSCYVHRSRLQINGKTLPFGINYRLYTTYKEKEITMSGAQARLMALSEYSFEHLRRTSHVQIISQNAEITEAESIVKISGNYSCFENIGEKQPFETLETEDELSE